jgi:hypothetical protein
VTTPYTRVVGEKRKAEHELRPYGVADVPAALVRPFIVVWAFARVRQNGRIVDSPTRIVLRPKGSTDASRALQPAAVEQAPQTFANGFGATWQPTWSAPTSRSGAVPGVG